MIITPWTQVMWLNLFMMFYLFADALEDKTNKNLGLAGHRKNALVRFSAISSMILLAFFPLFAREAAGHWILMMLATGFYLVFIGWFWFDIFYNLLDKKPVFKYIGSGTIDKWFKGHYKENAYIAMMLCKAVGALVTLANLWFAIMLYQGKI